MRSSVLLTAAFAAAAVAKPIVDRRGDVYVTDVDVVYVTEITTVTEGDPPVAAATAPPPSPTPGYGGGGYGGGRRKHRYHSKTGAYGAAPAPSNPAPAPPAQAPPAPPPAPTPEPTTQAPAPPPPPPTSYQQPEPAPSSYYQPPPAPSSSEAPAPPAYTPVSNEQQAPLNIHPEIILSEAPAQAQALPLPPPAHAPAPAPKSPVLHRLIPLPMSLLGVSAPDCHAEEKIEDVHLHKRGNQPPTQKKAVKVDQKQKKKPVPTPKKKSPKPSPKAQPPKKTTPKTTPTKTPTSKNPDSKNKAASSGSANAKTSKKPSSGTATTYQQAVVMHHNLHRANHSSPDIKWSQSLADTALKLAQTCQYQHNTQMDGGGYGQNIAAGKNATYIASVISDQFYNGEIAAINGQYGINPDMNSFESWGHLTQVVWADTTEVGCATWFCGGPFLSNFADGKTAAAFTVCNYKQAGNMVGSFAENVGACKDLPTVTGNDYVDLAAIKADYEKTVQNPNAPSRGY